MDVQCLQILNRVLNMYKRYALQSTNACVLVDERDRSDITSSHSLIVSPQLSSETGDCYVLLYFINSGDLIVCIPAGRDTSCVHKETIIQHAEGAVLPTILGALSNGSTRPSKGRNMDLTITVNDTICEDVDHVKGSHVLVAMVHIILKAAYKAQDAIGSVQVFERTLYTLPKDYWFDIFHEAADYFTVTKTLMDMASYSQTGITTKDSYSSFC